MSGYWEVLFCENLSHMNKTWFTVVPPGIQKEKFFS